MISDEEFDYVTYREYEDQLYNEDSWSEEDMDCEIEEALYSQVHYASSLLVSEKTVSGAKNTLEKTVDNDDSVIKILSSDEEEDDGTTLVTGVSSNSVAYPEVIHIYPSHDSILKNPEPVLEENGAEEEEIVENWHLIKEDLEDARKSKQQLRYHAKGKECRNCKETGHLAFYCPMPKNMGVCYLCGRSGHARRNCPNELCFNCHEPGHVLKQCQKPRARPFERCKRCHVKGHFAKDCPDRWRQYHLTTEVGPIVYPDRPRSRRRTVYCFSCGAGGHYGHECSEEIAVRRDQLYLPFVVKYDAYYNSAEGGKRKEAKSESRLQKKQSKAERRNEKVAHPEYDHLQCSQDIHDVDQDILVTEPPRKVHKLGKNKKGKRDEQSERVVEFRPSDQGFEKQYYHSRKRRTKQEKKRQDGTNLISRRESPLRNNNQMHGRRATQKKNRSQMGPNLISNGKNLHIIFHEHYTF